MSNVTEVRSKGIPIELDRPRTLKYDLNSFAELEQVYGSVEAAMKTLQDGSIKGIRMLLWAGLIHDEVKTDGTYGITPFQVGAMVTLPELQMISEKITEAMAGSLPEKVPPLPEGLKAILIQKTKMEN